MSETKPDEKLLRRFWSNVDKSGDCWLWIASGARPGYGQFRFNGRNQGTHRVAWQLVNGPIPKGLCVCHRCDVKRCVNPDHLFLGTSADNNRDMAAKGRLVHNNKGRTHCRRGHEFRPKSYYLNKRGSRCCLECDRMKGAAKRRGQRVPSVWARGEGDNCAF